MMVKRLYINKCEKDISSICRNENIICLLINFTIYHCITFNMKFQKTPTTSLNIPTSKCIYIR